VGLCHSKVKRAGGLCTELNLSFNPQAAPRLKSQPNTQNKKHHNPLPKSGLIAKMAREEVLHAYRHLYRAALRAVCYSQPASTVARDQLRRAFRDKTSTFNKNTVRRTVWFLNNAARERGTEHKIVKNLIFTQICKEKASFRTWKSITEAVGSKKKYVAGPSSAVCSGSIWCGLAILTVSSREDRIKDTAYDHYERTISMLNKTMGLCLPLR
jgi:hypothetical protein